MQDAKDAMRELTDDALESIRAIAETSEVESFLKCDYLTEKVKRALLMTEVMQPIYLCGWIRHHGEAGARALHAAVNEFIKSH